MQPWCQPPSCGLPLPRAAIRQKLTTWAGNRASLDAVYAGLMPEKPAWTTNDASVDTGDVGVRIESTPR